MHEWIVTRGRLPMMFYDCSTAPSPRRLRIYLAEKDIDLPTTQGHRVEPGLGVADDLVHVVLSRGQECVGLDHRSVPEHAGQHHPS